MITTEIKQKIDSLKEDIISSFIEKIGDMTIKVSYWEPGGENSSPCKIFEVYNKDILQRMYPNIHTFDELLAIAEEIDRITRGESKPL